MAVATGSALGTDLGFRQPLHGRGCSSAPLANGELIPSPSPGPVSPPQPRGPSLW